MRRTHPRWIRRVFSHDELHALTEAIRRAEARTSGQVRVHVERHVPRHRDGTPGDPLVRARHVFAHIGMHRTHHRNAVLIYLALDDRKLAVVGDDAIHARVGDAGWRRLRDLMVERLRAGRTLDALLEGVAEVGRLLHEHFPAQGAG
jgi:uncharacterized membrane protein